MRNLKRVSLVSLVSVALLGNMALPASAADTKEGINGATVAVEAGFLVLNTTNAAVTFDAVEASVGTKTTTATLTGVSVSDLNSDGIGWTSTAALTNLTFGEELNVKTIDTTAATYTSVVTAQEGTLNQVTAGSGATGNTVTAANGGNNSAVWTTGITIAVPNTTIKGTYTGTLTHSVL